MNSQRAAGLVAPKASIVLGFCREDVKKLSEAPWEAQTDASETWEKLRRFLSMSDDSGIRLWFVFRGSLNPKQVLLMDVVTPRCPTRVKMWVHGSADLHFATALWSNFTYLRAALQHKIPYPQPRGCTVSPNKPYKPLNRKPCSREAL